MHVNSHGFRTEEFTIPKPLGTYRILNLGDSVVFGWNVRQEDTYGKQLELLLTEELPGQPFQVINAGIPGWSPEEERNFILEEGLSYEPDLIILDLTVVNDIYGRGPLESDQPSFFQWTRDHTYGWPFLTTQARFLLARQFGPEAIPVLNPPVRAEAYYPLEERNPVWDRVWGFVEEINAASKIEHVNFLVVAFPTAFQLNSSKHPDTPQRVFADRAADDGIPFIDLLPVYREYCQALEPGACEGHSNALFVDVWMHPSSEGHRLAAKEILKAVDP